MFKKENRNSIAKKSTVLIFIFALVLLLPLHALAQENWKKLLPANVPYGRDDHMMAFHADKGFVVMFGGDGGGSATWVWDGKNWSDLGISESPAPRREAAMVYDSLRKKIVMFSGFDYVVQNPVTWEFDGEKWAGKDWGEDGPPGRSDHAMAYDSENGQTILFGGEGVDASTWAYDGIGWRTVATADDGGPSARWGHAMAYDSNRKRVVLFGGASSGVVDDTWEWDGSRWTQVATGGVRPPAMRDHVMVYDSFRKHIVLFGGRDILTEGFNATWEWDGVIWREISVDIRPSNRHEAAAAFDSIRNRVVLFGGSSGDLWDNRFNNETWVYPNDGPVIEHKPVTEKPPGKPIKIIAVIQDYDHDAVEARVYFRTTGKTGYRYLALTHQQNDRFTVMIPRSFVTEPGLEYFIWSRDFDGSGRSGYDGDESSPHLVIIKTYASITVRVSPAAARDAGALWKIVGVQGWYKSGTVVKKLAAGTYKIQFNNVADWIKPGRMTVTIEKGELTVVKAQYKQSL